jgi:iron complex outermembrane receptor protein
MVKRTHQYLFARDLRLPTWPLALILAASPARPDVPANSPEAADALKNLSLEELSRIEVITPSKEPVKAFKSPVAIYVITGEQIKRSGATCIPEALRLAPGVEVARIDSSKWSIGIRGFGSRFSRGVLVLIDGRTVYTTLLAGTYWEVQDTNMDDIDRIEVIRGPGGTIWGPNAVNGVINVITKDTKDTQGALASVGGGNYEQGFSNVRYGGGDGKDFTYRFYGKAFTRGPEDHSDGRNFDDWREVQGGFRMDWTRDPTESFTFQGDMYGEEDGESVQAISYTPAYSRIVDANAQLSGGNVLARWKKTLSGADDIQVQAYYDKTNRGEPNFGEVRSTFDLDFLQRLRLPARNEISWGAGTRFSLADDLEVVSGLTFQPAKRTDQLLTGFLQDQIGLVENKLDLILGTKLLHTNFTGFGAEPSARMVWTPDDKNTFWAAFTHALRTPSDAEENFYLSGFIGIAPDGTPEFARFNANTHFVPEQLNGYELGYRRLIGPNLYLDFAGFYNNHHDLFDEEITGPFYLESDPMPLHYLLPAQFGNGLLGTTKGGEIAPEWRITTFWQLDGSYSFLQMDIRPAPLSGDVGTAPGINGSSPKHEVTIHTALDFSKTVKFDADWRYVSVLPGQLVPAYSTADARLAWRFNRQFELSFVGNNLLQPSHPEFGGDPGPLVLIKRNAYAQLRWER